MELFILGQYMPIYVNHSKTYRESCYEQCHYTTLEDKGLMETYHAVCVNACEDNAPIEYTDDGFTVMGGFFVFFLILVALTALIWLISKIFEVIFD